MLRIKSKYAAHQLGFDIMGDKQRLYRDKVLMIRIYCEVGQYKYNI